MPDHPKRRGKAKIAWHSPLDGLPSSSYNFITGIFIIVIISIKLFQDTATHRPCTENITLKIWYPSVHMVKEKNTAYPSHSKTCLTVRYKVFSYNLAELKELRKPFASFVLSGT